MTGTNAYPAGMRALHWLVAVLVLTQLGIGMAMSGPDDELLPDFYRWHTSIGMLVLVFALVRLANRLRSRVPVPPATMPAWERVSARVVHCALYVLMVAVPALGYLAAGASPGSEGVAFFGLSVPSPVESSRSLAERLGGWHESLVWTLTGLLLIHVGAALKHAFFDRPEHNALRRML
jgi:cytochrome b561